MATESSDPLPQLIEAVEESPHSYDAHSNLITLLEQKVAAFDSEGSENPEDFRDVLAQARQNMSAVFPLTPQMWCNWIVDTVKALVGEDEEDCNAALDLDDEVFTEATNEDASDKGIAEFAKRLTEEALETVKELIEKSFNDYKSAEVAKLWAEILGIAASSISKLQMEWEWLISKIGRDVSIGGVIWSAYIQWSINNSNSSNSQSDANGTSKSSKSSKTEISSNEIRNLWKRRLSLPLEGNVEAFFRYSNEWETDTEREKEREEIRREYEGSLGALDAIRPYEERAVGSSDGPTWREYVHFCRSAKKKPLQILSDTAAVLSLYERAVAACCLDEELWIDYVEYCLLDLQDSRLVLQTLHRATRNVTWSSRLWCQYLLHAAGSSHTGTGESENDIHEIFQWAMRFGSEPLHGSSISTSSSPSVRTVWAQRHRCDLWSAYLVALSTRGHADSRAAMLVIGEKMFRDLLGLGISELLELEDESEEKGKGGDAKNKKKKKKGEEEAGVAWKSWYQVHWEDGLVPSAGPFDPLSEDCGAFVRSGKPYEWAVAIGPWCDLYLRIGAGDADADDADDVDVDEAANVLLQSIVSGLDRYTHRKYAFLPVEMLRRALSVHGIVDKALMKYVEKAVHFLNRVEQVVYFAGAVRELLRTNPDAVTVAADVDGEGNVVDSDGGDSESLRTVVQRIEFRCRRKVATLSKELQRKAQKSAAVAAALPAATPVAITTEESVTTAGAGVEESKKRPAAENPTSTSSAPKKRKLYTEENGDDSTDVQEEKVTVLAPKKKREGEGEGEIKEEGDSGAAMKGRRVLFVKGIAYSVKSTDELQSLWGEFPGLLEVRLVRDHQQPTRHKGFAYVEFKTEEDAMNALVRLDGLEVKGKSLRAYVSNPPKKGGAGGGSGGSAANTLAAAKRLQRSIASRSGGGLSSPLAAGNGGGSRGESGSGGRGRGRGRGRGGFALVPRAQRHRAKVAVEKKKPQKSVETASEQKNAEGGDGGEKSNDFFRSLLE